MFNKLQRRFLLMNLSIISVLLIIAFMAIYIVTYKNMQLTIAEDLIRVADFRKEEPPSGDDQIPSDKVQELPTTSDTSDPNKSAIFDRLPERTVSFTIITDDYGNVIAINSFFEADESFYTSALESVSTNQESGDFRLEGNAWAYLVTPKDTLTLYTFLDITAQQNMLDRLIYTFLIVFVVTFVFIYFISRFLTNRSIQPVKEAFEKQQQFISDASHELKTPLAVIRTNVDVLLQSPKEDAEENHKWLSYIKSEVGRMSKLTNDLLYLTQMSGDESQNLLNSTFDITDTVENHLLGLEALAFEKKIQFDYDLEPNITMYGNQSQISQVIMILLDNAIKYTDEGGKIDISLKKSTHHINFDVSNTGAGIDEDDLPHIFERFYRADKVRSRNEGSYGLGLAIAKAIVDQHQGKISCSSQPNGVTQFSLKFKLNTSV